MVTPEAALGQQQVKGKERIKLMRPLANSAREAYPLKCMLEAKCTQNFNPLETIFLHSLSKKSEIQNMAAAAHTTTKNE